MDCFTKLPYRITLFDFSGVSNIKGAAASQKGTFVEYSEGSFQNAHARLHNLIWVFAVRL